MGRGGIVAMRICSTLTILLSIIIVSCAGVRVNCSDDSLVSAMVYSIRTGWSTFIAVSRDGSHAQAFVKKDGKRVWLHVYPAWQWTVAESAQDKMPGGVGKIYTRQEFEKRYGAAMLYHARHLPIN